MSVENNSRLLGDRALDLLGELRRRLGAALARREQKSVWILGQDRPTTGEINVQKLAKDVRNLEGERRPVLHLFRGNDDMAHASRPGPDDMSAEMERGEVLHPHRRDQENCNCQRRLDPDRLGVTRRP